MTRFDNVNLGTPTAEQMVNRSRHQLIEQLRELMTEGTLSGVMTVDDTIQALTPDCYEVVCLYTRQRVGEVWAINYGEALEFVRNKFPGQQVDVYKQF